MGRPRRWSEWTNAPVDPVASAVRREQYRFAEVSVGKSGRKGDLVSLEGDDLDPGQSGQMHPADAVAQAQGALASNLARERRRNRIAVGSRSLGSGLGFPAKGWI